MPEKNKHKFAKPWLDPFKILDQVTPVDYRIEHVGTPNDNRVVRFDHLKLHETNDVSHEELKLPPLILDWDNTDPALLQKGIQIPSQRSSLRTSLSTCSASNPEGPKYSPSL